MAKIIQKIVVLGTGGTIAGTAASSADHTGYTAAQIGVVQLLSAMKGLPEALQGHALVAEQVAQIDSKNMDFATLARLSGRCSYWLAQADVAAVVVTHGTDTLEETAWFLHLTLPAALQYAKPVVLTCAMRPATSSQADGPRNMLDAVRVALESSARGVLAVCAGDVHCAAQMQKVHSEALNAFSSGYAGDGEDAGLAAQVRDGRVSWAYSSGSVWKKTGHFSDVDIGKFAINSIVNEMSWPRVEIVQNHSAASGDLVHALLEQRNAAKAGSSARLQGLVVAGTGNGTVSQGLQAALLQAREQGVAVLRSTRCVWGSVLPVDGDLLESTPLTPVKARISLVLQLLHRST